MKAIKSYLCFTSFLYRVLVLLVIPAVICVMTCVLLLDYIMPVYPLLMVFVVLEVFAEYWTFGGICAQKGFGSEYIKSSANGKFVLQSALLVDCIRKALWLVLLMGVNILYCYLKTGEPVTAGVMKMSVGMLVSAYGTILLGNYIGRYIQNYTILMFVAYLAGAVYVGISCVMMVFPFPVCILGAAADIGLSYLSIRHVIKKMEGSYYDGTN